MQVQHNEKDTFQEKGELKRGNQTFASLSPGTVSSEFGWGGLGGPVWTSACQGSEPATDDSNYGYD